MMKPKLTSEERSQLQKLLAIVQDEKLSISERAIAKIQFEQIYQKAVKRTIANEHKRNVAYA